MIWYAMTFKFFFSWVHILTHFGQFSFYVSPSIIANVSSVPSPLSPPCICTRIIDRMNYSFEEVFTVKVGLIENPSLGQTAIDWKGVTTFCNTFWREGEEYFDIFLQAFFPDGLFQLHMLCSSISDDKDNPIVRHVVQSHLNSWANMRKRQSTLP